MVLVGSPIKSAMGIVSCGESFVVIREEVTLNILEQTHLYSESYHTRLRRRNAFQAEMTAVSFIVVQRGVSQAAACDGKLYQVAPNDSDILPVQAGMLQL